MKMDTTVEKATHTPGPWHYNEDGSIIRVHFSLPDGRESGVAVSIGSTALNFRAPRQGSHRGETMVYRPFADHDRANARLIAAAPDLLEACRQMVDAVDSQDAMKALDTARAAISKAEPE